MKKFFCLIFCLFLFSGCKAVPQKYEKSFFAFDTLVTITCYGKNEALFKECEKMAVKYEKMLSKTMEGSDVYILNQKGKHKVSDETYYLLEQSLYYNSVTDGLFDITVGGLVNLWKNTVPTDEEIQNALKTVGSGKITLLGDCEVTLSEGTQIDLGAIAKGYIADKMAEKFREYGESGIINLGGNVYAVGDKVGEGFKIGVQKPGCEGETSFILDIYDSAVVTSGIYERFFEENGKEYTHIINPKTGYAVDNNFYSATVVSKSAMEADAFSTALLLMGEGAYNFAEENNIKAVFIDKNYTVVKTGDFD